MKLHTPITDLLNMTIREFYRVITVLCDVLEKIRNGGE